MQRIKVNDLLFFILIFMFVLFTLTLNSIVAIGFLLFLFFYVIRNLKNKPEIITILTLSFMLQMVFRRYLSGIFLTICEYFDEFMAILAVIYIFINAFRKKKIFLKFEVKIFGAMLLLIAIGLLSNYIYEYQRIIPILVDILTYCKFFVYYLAARIYANNNLKIDILKESLSSKIRIIAVFLFALAILNIIVPSLYEFYDYRYFANSIQLFFPHPTYLVAFSILGIIILLYDNNRKGNFKYLLMMSIVTIFTLRTKAIVSLIAIIYIYIVSYKMKIKSNILIIFCVVIVGIYIAYDQVEFYYLNDDIYTIRKEMTRDGIELANDKFPLGTGFATFGSSPADQFKSPLYYQLGYFDRGDQPLSDVFWPIIIAQNGWIGFVIFIYIIYSFLKYILKNIKKDTIFFVCSLSIFIYEIVASMAETAFFSPISPAYFIILGFMVNIHEKNIRKHIGSEIIEK